MNFLSLQPLGRHRAVPRLPIVPYPDRWRFKHCWSRSEASGDAPRFAAHPEASPLTQRCGLAAIVPVARTEDHDRAGKRSALLGLTELQAAAEETDFTVNGMGVPPRGVRSGGNQAHDGCAGPRRFERLTHPMANLAAIGRVHEHGLPRPALGQSVLRAGEMAGAARVGGGRAGIKREAKLPVQQLEEPVRCRPFIRARREVDGERADVAPPVSRR